MGDSEKVSGLAYVALSRVRSLYSLFIELFPFERLSMIKKSANFSFRVQDEIRLAELDAQTTDHYDNL